MDSLNPLINQINFKKLRRIDINNLFKLWFNRDINKKQLDKMENIELVIENNNIYDIKLICWSEKINTNIEFNIQIAY